MKIATQHYQDSVITPYGNNHWNGKEKIDISKEKDDAVILEISAKGKRAIQLKEKNEFEQDIVQVDKSADDLPASRKSGKSKMEDEKNVKRGMGARSKNFG